MPTNILIRTPNHLGDCIMALPMINETREAHPGSLVTVLAPDYLAELFEGNPAIDRILRIPARYVHGLIAVKKIKDIIASDEFDVGYILPPSFGAASSFKLAGVKERVGYIADGRRLLLSRPLPLPSPLNSEHRSEVYFNLLRRATKVSMDYVRPKLFLNDADIQKATDILAGFGFAEEDPYATIAFRAVAESRRWGVENYTELARRLVGLYNLQIILIGGPEDAPTGEKIVEAVGSDLTVNLAGKTSLRESAAVISRSRFFVGNDSGPAHLSSAVGVPIVVLSGADDPRETSPVSNRKKLVYLDKLACISCVKNRCPLKGEDHMRCMREITLPMVLDAVAELVPAPAG